MSGAPTLVGNSSSYLQVPFSRMLPQSIWHTYDTVLEDFLWLLIENGVVSGIYRYVVRAIQPLQRLLKLKQMRIGGLGALNGVLISVREN